MSKVENEIKDKKPQHEYAIIQIAETGDEFDGFQFVGGKPIKPVQIKRGEPVPVVAGVVSRLNSATKPTQVKVKSADGQIKTEMKIIKRIPFSVIRWISKDIYLELKKIISTRSLTHEEAYGFEA